MFNLSALPFNIKALEPIISENTINFHYGKHHQAYLDNLNKLIAESPLKELTLEEIIIKTKANKEEQAIYNNAAQVYNHDFFWSSLTAVGSEESVVSSSIKGAIESSFSSWDNFIAEFKNAALSQFGSGWAWLVKNTENKLMIVKTANADNPLTLNLKPLLVIDVWEHAYYLDYQNRRADFLDQVLNNLVNWKEVEKRYLED